MFETERVNLHLDVKTVEQIRRLAKRESLQKQRRVYPVEIYRRFVRAGLKAEKDGKK